MSFLATGPDARATAVNGSPVATGFHDLEKRPALPAAIAGVRPAMNERALEIKAIFAQAFELDSPADRERYLAEACRADARLRGEAESLLKAFAGAGDSGQSHVFSTMTPEERQASEVPSAVIDAYKLLEQIGEGGMGIVYMAEQTRPIQRKVALKIIKPGTSSRQVIARFEAERQALALMDHPNIAKVLDAGSTAAGRPYFVMELVKGIPITDYCDRVRLTPRERLELLVPVCQAIQHAHQKGIIHRDIKPSNVLVSLYDGKPVPKVIDFGVAKAIDQRLTEHTLFTQHGAIVGTLEYMSPEQAENSALDIDTRTDVYALGVLLYELMTGTTPLERQRVKEDVYSELLRRIREEEPPRLSTRLSKTENRVSIAAGRNMEPAKLARLLRGELDWIATQSAGEGPQSALRDGQRHGPRYRALSWPASRWKRVRRRPRIGFVSSRANMSASWRRRGRSSRCSSVQPDSVAGRPSAPSGKKPRRGMQKPKRRTSRSFFETRVLGVARPRGNESGLGRDVTMRAALDRAESSIATDFANRPRVEAAIRDTLGTTYARLGELALAIRQLERAVALRTSRTGPRSSRHVDLNR